MKPFAALKSLYDRVICANDGELLQHPQHKTHNMLNVEALLASLSLCLITGTNQSGFFIEAGVGDSALAFLGAMATITGIVAPFGGMIFSRMPKRRWLILTCILIARLLYASVVFVPLLVPNRPALSTGLMLGFVIVGGVLDATANVGAEIWMAAIVPPEIRGRYMAARNVLVNAIVPLWSLLSAAYLDIVQYRYDAFVIVFSIGAVLVIADALLMSRIPEPVYEVPVQQKVSVKEVLKKIWAAKPYLVFCCICSLPICR